MKKFKRWHRIAIFIFGLFILLLFIHHFIFRPMILDWGAPEEIRTATLSGDSLTVGEHHTRAILIDATPADVWPWLVQLGQDRGGFYSYQWLENMFRAQMKNAYDIKLEFQNPRQVGDTLWLAAKTHYGGNAYQVVEQINPQNSMVLVSGDDFSRIRAHRAATGSWAFYLRPASAKQTWLIVRSSNGQLNAINEIMRYFFFEVPHFIMERKMLQTIKHLAERKKDEVNVVNDQDDIVYNE